MKPLKSSTKDSNVFPEEMDIRVPRGASAPRQGHDLDIVEEQNVNLHFREGEGMAVRTIQPKDLSGPKPEVIVDFIFDEGLFFIAIQNINDLPAYKVSMRFKPGFKGVEGKKRVSELPLFRNIEFLAPRKEIRTFLDTSAAYFRRREPTLITAQISYEDEAGRKYSRTIRHDLSIYAELGYIRRTEGNE